jgi:hypothetical protein
MQSFPLMGKLQSDKARDSGEAARPGRVPRGVGSTRFT